MNNSLNTVRIRLMSAILLIVLFSMSAFMGCVHINIDRNPTDKKLELITEKTFPSEDNKNLNIKTHSGDVRIVSWDKKEVKVSVYGNAKAKEKCEFNINQDESSVNVKVEKAGSVFNFMSNVSIKVEVSVPENTNASVSTAGGDIEATKMQGRFEFKTAGGDIKLSGLNGNAEAETSGGDIRISNFYGILNAATSGGDIKVDKTTGDIEVSTSGGDINVQNKDGRLKASTSGGDIRVDYYGPNRGIELSTSGGDINVVVDPDFASDFKLSTLGGEVNCALPAELSKNKSSQKEGRTNKGGSKLECSTLGGDIRVKGR